MVYGKWKQLVLMPPREQSYFANNYHQSCKGIGIFLIGCSIYIPRGGAGFGPGRAAARPKILTFTRIYTYLLTTMISILIYIKILTFTWAVFLG
jgi:hypothetical protein